MINLGLLGVFKYFDFFADNFAAAFSVFGVPVSGRGLDLVLPVGISFYTFQTLSYAIDVYRRRLAPTTDLVQFAAYVSFFPQLVAGPIERATHLLPQFARRRTFDATAATDGLRQILWGLVKKVVVADTCAVHVNAIFAAPDQYPGAVLVMGAVLFAFQIYGDFSGYSDIAIGTARLFGFDLTRNFAFPYFSRDIAEFWRRWHISLSTWFRDYVSIPLGGSRGSTALRVRNTFIIFLVSGFWHGANWTFVVWDALHAAYFLPLLLAGANRRHLDIVAPRGGLPTGGEVVAIAVTFALTTVAWVFFRAEDLHAAIAYLAGLARDPGAFLSPRTYWPYRTAIFLVLGFVAVEWLGRTALHALARGGLPRRRPLRLTIYYALVFAVCWFGGSEQVFIYFQF